MAHVNNVHPLRLDIDHVDDPVDMCLVLEQELATVRILRNHGMSLWMFGEAPKGFGQPYEPSQRSFGTSRADVEEDTFQIALSAALL